jgi:hypothetical protein
MLTHVNHSSSVKVVHGENRPLAISVDGPISAGANLTGFLEHTFVGPGGHFGLQLPILHSTASTWKRRNFDPMPRFILPLRPHRCGRRSITKICPPLLYRAPTTHFPLYESVESYIQQAGSNYVHRASIEWTIFDYTSLGGNAGKAPALSPPNPFCGVKLDAR